MKKRLFILALAVSVIALTLMTVPGTVKAADQVFKWDMTYPLYRGTWDWAVLEKWCADLKKASGGRLVITPKAGGEIMPVLETFDAVSTGAIKMDFSYGPYWIGKLPMAIYASGLPPFTLPAVSDYQVLYHELGWKKLIQDAFAKHNIHYVGTIPTNNAVLLSKFPVKSAADFKNKKLRATGIYAEVMAELGAAPVYFPWGEIYGSLEKGTIDGVIAGPLGVQCDAAFHEPTKFFLETPITTVDAWCLLVNLETWKKLPEDLQTLLTESCSYAAELFSASYYGYDVKWRTKLVKDFKFTITSLPQSDMKGLTKATMKVLEKYSAKDADFAKATEILKKYMQDSGQLDK